MASATGTTTELRPRFADGQVLGAEDLEAEQEYLVAGRRRHLLSGHTPGIVTGLEPSLQNGTVTVSPGLAIDGYGRELVVTEASSPTAPAGARAAAGNLGIYVQYSLEPGIDADPAHPRVVEAAVLLKEAVQTDAPAAPDLTAVPDDSTAPPWPVLLGVLDSSGAKLDLSSRRYAGGIGSAVRAPQGTSRLAFDRSGTASVAAGGATTPAVVVDAGGINVSGDARCEGDVKVGVAAPAAGSSGAPRSAARADLQRQPAPKAASPWSVYRALLPAAPAAATTPATRAADELRVELPAPPTGPNPTQQGVSFGTQPNGGAFGRILSVLDDGTVLVNGNLTVNGRLATGSAQVDASDPRFVEALVQNYVHGVVAGTQALEEMFQGSIALADINLSYSVGEISCQATVSNTGSVSVKGVTVTAAVWAQGGTAPSPDHALDPKGINLAPGASQAVSGTLTPRGTGTMNVLLHAAGKGGSRGTPIAASDVTDSVAVQGGAA